MKRITFLIISFTVLALSCQNGQQPRENVQQESPEQKTQVPIPEWSKNAIIYEVNIRQFSEGGTFDEFTEEIPRLKELGVDILWLMPIFPIGEKNRKGDLGSYYSIRDYRAVNPDHGTMEDFLELIEEAHSLGMRVILDWVANHSAWDNYLITEHPEWYTHDSLGNIIVPEGTDWTDVADFNFENSGLWDYMTGSLGFWIREADIDGYRCDVAGMVPSAFWDQAYDSLIILKPDIFLLAEWDQPELHEVAFHMSYAWDMHHVLNDIAAGKKGAGHLDSMLTVERARYLPEAFRMNFTSNHDENSWHGSAVERMGDARMCLAALTYVIPGMPLIYSGQEADNSKRLEFFDKDLIEWKDDPIADLYTNLNDLKHENPALWNGAWGGSSNRIHVSDPNVMIMQRISGENEVTGIFNLQKIQTTFTVPSELADSFKNLDGNTIALQAGQAMDLQAWDYLVLSK